MNKKDFEKFINLHFKDIPLEKFEQDLLKMKKVWIPQILENKLKDKLKCKKCGKYSKKEHFKIEDEIKIVTETTFRDVGYGDDDKTGEVEYLFFYQICPICGNKSVKEKLFLRIVNEYSRYE